MKYMWIKTKKYTEEELAQPRSRMKSDNGVYLIYYLPNPHKCLY